MRLVGLTAIFCVCVISGAAGQTTDRWLIVPTTIGSDDSWAEPTASRIRAELNERGIDVWALSEAAARFEERGSAPPPRVTEDEFQSWLANTDAAVEALVRGIPSQALDRLDPAQELSRGAIEALNRNGEHTQAVLDMCLYRVRALIEIDAGSRAEEQARECRQLVPVGEPSARMHPPVVSELFDEIEMERAEQTGSLSITSEPSNCAARVNGLKMGETPFSVDHLFPGRYRVQVECEADERGRVHAVDVTSGRTEVFVDARFDRAVHTRPILELEYTTPSSAEQHREIDAARVARIVPAESVVLVSTPDTAVLEVELLAGAPLETRALARIRSGFGGPTRGDIALASRTLIGERCMDLTTLPATVLRCEEGPVVAETKAPSDAGGPAKRRPRGQFISGLTLLGIGSAGLVTGYALLGPRARAGEDWVNALDAGSPSASFQQKWYNLRSGIIATSTAGAGALVAAMPLVLPNHTKTPWWAWLSGGVGVGLAAFSIAYGVGAEPEPDPGCSSLITDAADARDCVKRIERTTIAVATGVTAAPLLTIPLIYLFRRSETKIKPRVEVSRASGYVSVRGEF